MKKINVKRVEASIKKTLSQYFENIRIIQAHVEQDVDRDGEHILRIDVVFEGDLKEADARQVAGAARHLRPVLEEIDADLYPLLSFVSKVDYDRGRGRRASH